MSIAVCDVSIAPVDLSIVNEALSTCPDEVSIALRVWITICRRGVIDTWARGGVRLRRGDSGCAEPEGGAPGAREGGELTAEGEGDRECSSSSSRSAPGTRSSARSRPPDLRQPRSSGCAMTPATPQTPAPASSWAAASPTRTWIRHSVANGRALVAHEDSKYREWGASGAVRSPRRARARPLVQPGAAILGGVEWRRGVPRCRCRPGAAAPSGSDTPAGGDAGRGRRSGPRRDHLGAVRGGRGGPGGRAQPRRGVKGGEKPDQRAEQNTATAAIGVRWSEEAGIRLGAAGAGNAGRA